MNKEINLKQANINVMNGEDYYAHAAAALIGVVAGLLGGLFIV